MWIINSRMNVHWTLHCIPSMQINMSILVRLKGGGDQGKLMSDNVLAKLHNIQYKFYRCNWVSLLLMWIIILQSLHLHLASSFKYPSVSCALLPGRQSTVVAGVSRFTSQNRMTNYQSSLAGVPPSGGKWLDGDMLHKHTKVCCARKWYYLQSILAEALK